MNLPSTRSFFRPIQSDATSLVFIMESACDRLKPVNMSYDVIKREIVVTRQSNIDGYGDSGIPFLFDFDGYTHAMRQHLVAFRAMYHAFRENSQGYVFQNYSLDDVMEKFDEVMDNVLADYDRSVKYVKDYIQDMRQKELLLDLWCGSTDVARYAMTFVVPLVDHIPDSDRHIYNIFYPETEFHQDAQQLYKFVDMHLTRCLTHFVDGPPIASPLPDGKTQVCAICWSRGSDWNVRALQYLDHRLPVSFCRDCEEKHDIFSELTNETAIVPAGMHLIPEDSDQISLVWPDVDEVLHQYDYEDPTTDDADDDDEYGY